ncbi:hypothetical protein GW17_00058041 [Ensete ventricosum]|nr:hypothetical protein GW17_00058041 [Ensete ventricosum]
MRWDLAGSSLGDSPKESGSSLGTRREITGKKTEGLAARLPEVAGVYGTMVGPPVPQNSGGGQRLSVGKLPKWRVNRPYHRIWVVASY